MKLDQIVAGRQVVVNDLEDATIYIVEEIHASGVVVLREGGTVAGRKYRPHKVDVSICQYPTVAQLIFKDFA